MPTMSPLNASPLDVLSDVAVELAMKRPLDIDAAARQLVERTGANRELLEALHARHTRRMAHLPSDDFRFVHALHVIESAVHLVPRQPSIPFPVHAPA